MTPLQIGLILLAACAGALITYLISRMKSARLEERISILKDEKEEREARLDAETTRANESENKLSTLQAKYQHLSERLAEQKAELSEMQTQFRDEFRNLANDILEEKSKKFTEQNREKLDQLLKPLGEKIQTFQKQVEEAHKEDIKGRSALDQHLKMLQDMNQNLKEEAKNLTKALKGDTKQQGNWGEMILERILEKSGLTKGREYETQVSIRSEDGRNQQPDVVVYLPDEKRLVIDSKVSLNAYEEYSSADDPDEQVRAVKRHVTSLRNHIRGLSGKDYAKLHGSKSPDFILMFIPIESAFGVAMQNTPELYNEAFDKNIIIVSPTTLLATLATIDNVWKQEYQNQNAMEIAKRGGLLYDKFVGFVDNLNEVGQRIEQSQQAYDHAMKQLSTGRGNLVGQAEKLRDLGASSSKKLPEDLLQNSDSNRNER
jgi:DNA recombination protein RmuC